MSTQVEPVAEAAVMEVEEHVATVEPPVVDRALIAQLVGDAQRQGLSVEGEGGLLAQLAQLTKLVLESALEARSPLIWAMRSTSGPMRARTAVTGPGPRRC